MGSRYLPRDIINRFCDIKFHSVWFSNLGEFPLVEGSFPQLIYVQLPNDWNADGLILSSNI